MKIIAILFLISFSNGNSIVEKLNNLKKELKYCSSENQIADWTIFDARDFIIKFEEAIPIKNKPKTYRLTGKVTEWNEDPIEGMRIEYGEYEGEICKADELTGTDSYGHFEIEVTLSPRKFITFNQLGYKWLFINLGIE